MALNLEKLLAEIISDFAIQIIEIIKDATLQELMSLQTQIEPRRKPGPKPRKKPGPKPRKKPGPKPRKKPGPKPRKKPGPKRKMRLVKLSGNGTDGTGPKIKSGGSR